MAGFIVPNIDDNLQRCLMERAVKHGHSMEIDVPSTGAAVVGRSLFDAQVAAIARACRVLPALRDTRDFA